MISANDFGGIWNRYFELNHTHTLDCFHTSAIAFICTGFARGSVQSFTINGKTITFVTPLAHVTGIYDGNRTIRWSTRGIWVKQEEGKRKS